MKNGGILVIDDEAAIRKLLEITLQASGYPVWGAANAVDGLRLANELSPELILLDLGLPDESGHRVLEKLRKWFNRPIIILSVQSAEEEIVRALDSGANDYLVKPFRTGELLARIRSNLRNGPAQVLKLGASENTLEIDIDLRAVRRNGEPVKLTATEFQLLALLVKNEGRVLTHQNLLREVWGPGYVDQSQYLRVFIAQLRKKLEAEPNHPEFIITESGVGYRFVTKD
jgi:two-component system, OmpR family, KDP operon response regulator KdpE